MKNITGTPRERKRNTIKSIIFTCIVAASLIGLAIYINNDYIKKNNAILEQKRVNFLEKIIGFDLSGASPTISTDASYVSFRVEKISGYATEIIDVHLDTKTQSQRYYVFVSSKNITVRWRKDLGVEYQVEKNLQTGKINFNEMYINEETAAILLERGMYWFYMVRKYFRVDTLDELKSKIKEQQTKQEFNFK